MIYRNVALFCLVLFALVLSACAPRGAAGNLTKEWTLTELNGQALIPGRPPAHLLRRVISEAKVSIELEREERLALEGDLFGDLGKCQGGRIDGRRDRRGGDFSDPDSRGRRFARRFPAGGQEDKKQYTMEL